MLEKRNSNQERETGSDREREPGEGPGLEEKGALISRRVGSQTTNPELKYVHEQLLRLPTANIHSFFLGLRDLINQLNTKITLCEDEVSFMREEIPHKMIELRQCRKELLALRSAVKNCSQECASKHSSFMRALEKKGPDVFVKLNYVSSLERRLKELRNLRSWMLYAEQLESAITSSHYDALLCSLQKIGDFSFEQQGCEMERELCARRNKLMENTRGSVDAALKNVLSDLGYPLEEHIDMQNSAEKIAALVTLLKCVHLMEVTPIEGTAKRKGIVDQLFDPFEKRFRFHFYQNLKTNDDTKPEWFFTQVLTWLNVNCEFFETVLGAVFAQASEAIATQKVLEKKLVGLAITKALSLAERVVSDSTLFSHLIDEAVAFENELNDAGYISLVGGVLGVFCVDPFIVRWLQLERQSCTSGVECALMSEARWNNRYSKMADLDMHRVPECADQFVVMIESMTQRYRWIPDFDVQARFLELQVVMLDEFRLRLVQISEQLYSPWEEPFVQLLNSFWYIGCVLEEWNDAEAFIKVQTRGTNVPVRGVFDDMAEMYRHVWRQRATDMALAFHQFVRSQLSSYAKLNWYSMESTKPTDLTPALCPFLLELRLLLGTVASSISPHSAFTLYSLLNQKIGDALLQLIDGTSFNCHGAAQMLFDVTSSLVPLLNSLYSRSAMVTYEALDDHKFEEAVSSLKLLSVPTATAMLLRSEIRKSPEEMTATILASYDASIISRERALALLEQRCDLQVDSDARLRF